MKANPTRGQGGGSARPEKWRAIYGHTPTYDAVADLWDLQAAKAGLKGKKARHPRGALPGASRRRGRTA